MLAMGAASILANARELTNRFFGSATVYCGAPLRLCSRSKRLSSTMSVRRDMPFGGGSRLRMSNRTCVIVCHKCSCFLLTASRGSASAAGSRTRFVGEPGSGRNTSESCMSLSFVSPLTPCDAILLAVAFASRSRHTEPVVLGLNLACAGGASVGRMDGGDASFSVCMPSRAPLIRDIVSVSADIGASR